MTSCIVHTLGPLIHNPLVVAELRRRGVEMAATVDDVESGIIVLRSHGVTPQVVEAALAKGLTIVDATCPHVSKAQQAAQELREQGYTVVVVGERGHPEVEAISAYAGEGAVVVQEPADLPAPGELPSTRIGVVVQTTQTEAALAAIVEALQEQGIEPEVRDTICFATRQRQEAASELAGEVDVMIVVGGRNSGNTTRLAQICEAFCPNTYHIESPAELDDAWFEGAVNVGITAGASTPEAQIVAVEEALRGV
jgi:4-hydroxy-3-methylbut-2-enyl diphosphate reductase